MIKFLILLFPIMASARWQVGVGTGSYLGAAQLQTQWTSYTRTHNIYLSYGYTRDPIVDEIRQYTFGYQVSPLEIKTPNKIYDPILFGPFFTQTDNENYFFHSRPQYKNIHYYDVTSFRWGLRLSSQIILEDIGPKPLVLSLDGSLLEQGLTVLFNNPKEIDVLKYFWSLGFSIRMEL